VTLLNIKCLGACRSPGRGSNMIHGPTAQKTAMEHLANSGHPLISTISVDSDLIMTWDRWHWKAYLFRFPYIRGTSNLDYVCDLGIGFSPRCSWTPRQTRTRDFEGLRLDLDVPSDLFLLQVFLQILYDPLHYS
jgi:hypothetical protein